MYVCHYISFNLVLALQNTRQGGDSPPYTACMTAVTRLCGLQEWQEATCPLTLLFTYRLHCPWTSLFVFHLYNHSCCPKRLLIPSITYSRACCSRSPNTNLSELAELGGSRLNLPDITPPDLSQLHLRPCLLARFLLLLFPISIPTIKC